MTIGHQRQLEILERSARQGSLHHAQLFIGPKGLGKTKIALHLAVILQEAEDNVVYKKQILTGLDPDTLLYLDKGDSLPIKQVREMITRLNQSHNRPHLVVIIEDLGRMKAEAMNALLKTLEEPHPGVQFFLSANREEDVLPTIRSRCHVTRFQTVPNSILAEACDGHADTEQLVHFAMGKPGKLIRLKEDREYFEAHQNLLTEVDQFLHQPSHNRAFQLMRDHEKSEHRSELLDILLMRVRSYALEGHLPLHFKDLNLADTLERIDSAHLDLKQNVNAKLTLETLFLSFVS